MKRVLFVDDDPQALDAIRLQFRGQPTDWETEFTSSANDALRILETRDFDAIVADLRMPGVDGIGLLAEVARRFPQTIRVLVSDAGDGERVARSVGVSHQFLSKPCDVETVLAVLRRLTAPAEQRMEEKLRSIVAQVGGMPSPPDIYLRISEELRLPDASIRAVGELIADDPPLTAKLLQLVNSPFFGLSQTITSAVDAAAYLGLDRVRALVLATYVFQHFQAPRIHGFSVERLWKHCLTVGSFAEQIAAVETEDRAVAEAAYTAGILHDAGKMILATHLPGDYSRVLTAASANRIPSWAVEMEIFGATHAEVGAHLLHLWGLPAAIIDGVSFHHRPFRTGSSQFDAAAAVHVADAFDHQMHDPEDPSVTTSVDPALLRQLHLDDHQQAWRNMCRRYEL